MKHDNSPVGKELNQIVTLYSCILYCFSVAERCNCLGMNVIGVTRSIPTEDTRCPAVSEYR